MAVVEHSKLDCKSQTEMASLNIVPSPHSVMGETTAPLAHMKKDLQPGPARNPEYPSGQIGSYDDWHGMKSNSSIRSGRREIDDCCFIIFFSV